MLVLLLLAITVWIVAGAVSLMWRLHHPRRKTIGDALGRGHPIDPSELGLAALEAELQLWGESRTPAWLIEGGRPCGPLVVVTHGWSDSRYVALARWAELLAPRASTLVLYDMRGHGDQPDRRFSGGWTEQDDLESVIRSARRTLESVDPQRALRPCVLAGHSLGATISLLVALRGVEPIAGVWADSIMANPHDALRRRVRRRGWPAEPVVSLGLLLARACGDAGLPDPRTSRPADSDPAAGSIHMIHALDDPICDIDRVRDLVQRLSGARLKEIAGSGHRCIAELDPAGYLVALDAFFEGLETA
ncbi:MAG: alpha/beta hydrolase [Phycisphaeraceae bacterium]|nr:alpha/beta hydrolase [Phycisphaeraceae bacterium]